MDQGSSKIIIPGKYKNILIESIEDQMYKVSLLLEKLKGKPLTKERKVLTKKQAALEELQHIIHASG